MKSIKEFVADMRIGDPPLVVEHRHQIDYIRNWCKEFDYYIVQRKQKSDAGWLVWRYQRVVQCSAEPNIRHLTT